MDENIGFENENDAENDIKLSDQFKYLFENPVVGLSITSTEGKLRINETFSKILGYSVGELIDSNWRDITHKDDIEPNENYVKAILKGEYDSKRWEKRYIHKDGHIVWVDINTSLKRDKNGKPLFFITALIDISERKKAEDSLKHSQNELQNLIELSPVAIGIIHKWRTVYFNPAAIQLFGAKTKEELLDRHIYDFIHPDYHNLAITNSKLLAEKGYVPIQEQKYKKLDGTILDVETQAKSIRFNDGPATLVVMKDITERKQAEDALIKKNADLDYMNKFMVNREVRMAEMKREVNELLERLGEEKRYL